MDVVNPVVRRWVQDAAGDPDGFWGRAAEGVHWFKRWETTFEWEPPTFRWFVGGLTNIAYNCLDLQVARGRDGQAAMIGLNERGERRDFSYAELLAGVEEIAAGLRGLGVTRGDRVAIYMPTMVETVMAMLATTRIGAIHLVVFAGFGSGALAERMEIAGTKVLLTADVTFRKGREVDLWTIARDALDAPESPVERVVVLGRTGKRPELTAGRDVTWEEFLAGGVGQSGEHEVMEANEAAYVLATSGTTAKPKLVVHTHGGYQVGIHSMGQWVMDLKPEDVWWPTADIGWAVGHSYLVYAPLLAGCTAIAYEGALDYPSPENFYRIVAELSRDGDFYGADGGPDVDGLWDGSGAGVRFGVGGAGGLRGGDVECAGLGVVAEGGLPGSGTGDRSHVANGDGRPGVWESVRDQHAADQTGVGGDRVAGDCRGGAEPGRGRLRAGGEGNRGLDAAVPEFDADDLGRPGTIRAGLLGTDAGSVFQRRCGVGGRGRVLLVQRAGGRDHQDRGAPDRDDRSRDGVAAPPGGGGGGGNGAAG